MFSSNACSWNGWLSLDRLICEATLDGWRFKSHSVF